MTGREGSGPVSSILLKLHDRSQSQLFDFGQNNWTEPDFQRLGALQKIQEYVAVVETKHKWAPSYMRFDNAKELVGPEVRKWAAEKGIVIETTAPYSPAQNGIAK